jgi:hypothetical protein
VVVEIDDALIDRLAGDGGAGDAEPRRRTRTGIDRRARQIPGAEVEVSPADPCVPTTTIEFYEIDEAVPVPKLDRDGTELPLGSLTPVQQHNYAELSAQLQGILATAPDCPRDGNIDSLVDQKDLDEWGFYSQSWGLSSVYDFNFDGLTDAADEAIIQENLGRVCRSPTVAPP